MVFRNSIRYRGFLSRRAFLIGACSSALAMACSSSSAMKAPVTGIRYLRSGFADGLVSPSSLVANYAQRAPFFFFAADGKAIVNDLPDQVSGILTMPSGKETSVTLQKDSEGIPTPYFLLEFESGEVGLHRLSIGEGNEAQSLSFLLVTKDEAGLVQVGDEMKIAETPTFSNPLDFNPICTRFDPCPFHTMTLEDALLNGSPTVLLISTPGFCQTSICGPVLEILLSLLDQNQRSFNVIHAEVYSEPEKLSLGTNLEDLLAPVVVEYGMNFEPSLIVSNIDGVVTARLDYAFDRVELERALSSIS